MHGCKGVGRNGRGLEGRRSEREDRAAKRGEMMHPSREAIRVERKVSARARVMRGVQGSCGSKGLGRRARAKEKGKG